MALAPSLSAPSSATTAALSTYPALLASVANWLNRNDNPSEIADFVAMAHAQINRDVRHWRQNTSAQLTALTRYTLLPDDWLSTRQVQTSAGHSVDFLSSDDMEQRRRDVNDTPGIPCFYRHEGQQLELFPSPSEATTITLQYKARIPSLGGDNQTNWLMVYAPDIYLYGSLIQGFTFYGSDERLPVAAAQYAAAVQRLNNESNESEFSGAQLRVRGRR